MSQFDFHTRLHPDLNKTPGEFVANDLKHCSITKDNVDTPNGLVIERRKKPNTTKDEYYVKEVTPGGLFHQLHATRIQAGDRLVKVNGKSVASHDFTSLWDINNELSKSTNVTVHVQRGGLHLEPKQEWQPAGYAPGNPPSKGGWSR